MEIECKIVGVTFEPAKTNLQNLKKDSKIELVPYHFKKDNIEDEFAVRVEVGGEMFGHIPKPINKTLHANEIISASVNKIWYKSKDDEFPNEEEGEEIVGATLDIELKDPKITNSDGFELLTSFTGEKIMYNDDLHKYKDLEGNALLSGSAYKKSFDRPFDLENISKSVAKKYEVDQQTIKDMWSHNSKTSIFFGNALHNAMEQWYRFREDGTEKEYHLPKHPFLRGTIESFPLKNQEVIPEVLVSDVKNGRVGQIDGIQITGEKTCVLIDYKTDANVEKNVEGHFKQLSFYAHILKEFGWNVEKVAVWNYTTEWKEFESPVLELE